MWLLEPPDPADWERRERFNKRYHLGLLVVLVVAALGVAVNEARDSQVSPYEEWIVGLAERTE